MVIALALAFFLSATITIYTLFRIGDTRVPDIIGKPEAEAQKLAEKAGLKVKVTRRNDAAPADTVIETRPGPNASVKKDSTLSIVVSTGPAKSQNQLPVAGSPLLVFSRHWSSLLPVRIAANSEPAVSN
ncbi:MAG: PASTA domain-containing protein [Blastocatellia bacterium]